MDVDTKTSNAETMIDTRIALSRWLIHLGLILTAIVSLALEFVIAVHIIVGLIFVVFVGVHLAQRRRVSMNLIRRLPRITKWAQRSGRMAVSDTLLLTLTLGMLASGFVDLAIGHPTRLRWHAITGVVLAIWLVVHTLRRRTRLKKSSIH